MEADLKRLNDARYEEDKTMWELEYVVGRTYITRN
jgi:hypothetical protein